MTSNLYVKYAKLLQDIPTFVTDLRADAGKRQYKYLGLDTLLKGVKPVFAKHNMGFYQSVEYVSGEDKPLGIVRTVIFDETDTLTVGSYPFFVLGDPQAVGSAVTYARRYSLYAALGIFPEKDDDGYGAAQSHSGQAKASAKDWQAVSSDAQAAGVDIRQLVQSTNFGHPVTRPQDLTKADIMAIRAQIVKAGE